MVSKPGPVLPPVGDQLPTRPAVLSRHGTVLPAEARSGHVLSRATAATHSVRAWRVLVPPTEPVLPWQRAGVLHGDATSTSTRTHALPTRPVLVPPATDMLLEQCPGLLHDDAATPPTTQPHAMPTRAVLVSAAQPVLPKQRHRVLQCHSDTPACADAHSAPSAKPDAVAASGDASHATAGAATPCAESHTSFPAARTQPDAVATPCHATNAADARPSDRDGTGAGHAVRARRPERSVCLRPAWSWWWSVLGGGGGGRAWA